VETDGSRVTVVAEDTLPERGPNYEPPGTEEEKLETQMEELAEPSPDKGLEGRITTETREESLELEIDELCHEVKPESPSTYDSYNQSLSSASPPAVFHRQEPPDSESMRPPMTRPTRVAFAEEQPPRSILPLERRISHSSTSPESQYSYPNSSSPQFLTFPRETSSGSGKRSRDPNSPLRPAPPKRPRAEQLKPHIHIKELSWPATVLLTNPYSDWSQYCVCLGYDGNIFLLSNKTHAPMSNGTVFREDYTAIAAVNGAWISPGTLAIVHKDSRRNRDFTQISLINYFDSQISRHPRATPMIDTPHSNAHKISSICPLWSDHTSKAFVTGDFGGHIYMWTVKNKDEPEGLSRIDTLHGSFLGTVVSALGYLPQKDWLLSSGGRSGLLVTHDLVTGQEIGHRRQKQTVTFHS